MSRVAQRGFTLLELIMVIIIVALASIPILGQFSQVSGSLLLDEEIQTAAQLAQERAEGILANRRDQGYGAVPAGAVTDVLAGNYAGYSRTVTVNEPPAGGGCAAGASCKEVIVSVNRGAGTLAELTFILVSY